MSSTETDARATALARAMVHRRRGQTREAFAVYKSLLDADPKDHETMHLAAGLMAQTGDNIRAAQLLSQCARLKPDFVEAQIDLGVVLRRLGKLAEAEAVYGAVLRLAPNHPDALYNYANLKRALKRDDQAAALYQRTLKARPDHAGALNNLGLLLHDRGDYAGAVKLYHQALRDHPDNPELHNNLGNAFKELERYDAAVTCYDRALEQRPRYAEAHSNLGVVRQLKGDETGAEQAFRRSLEIFPDNAVALNGLGFAAFNRLDLAAAEEFYRRALAVDPESPEVHWNRAHLLLITGRFEEGWREYDWRFRCPGLSAYGRVFEQPLWDGRSLKGERVFLPVEQGLGDVIQFSRYVPLVKAQGGQPVLECPPELFNLMVATFGREQVLPRGEAPRGCAFHAPLMSLPRILGVMPSPPSYLAPPSSSVNLPDAGGKRRIGLVWAGRPSHRNDHNRSMPLTLFAPLLAREDCRFVSLQVGTPRADITASGLAGQLTDIADGLTDFAATASVVKQLDLVIAVDTAVAHLAGALGKPVWTLLPYVPDWRWLVTRSDTPWYPSMRLFRQKRIGDWNSVIAEVTAAL